MKKFKITIKEDYADNYDNYIFDLYGTIVDIHTDESKASLWKDIAMFYSLQGASYDAKEFKAKYMSLCEKEVKALPGRDDEVEIDIKNVFKKLFEDKLVSPSEILVNDAEIMFRASSLKYIKLYPRALKTLQELQKRGKKLYLLSNAQADFTIPELKYLEIYNIFDKIYISSECGYKKPSKEFMDKLIKEEKINIERSIMIGNSLEDDVEVAKRCKMDSFFIKSNISPKEDNLSDSTATYSFPMKNAYKALLSI